MSPEKADLMRRIKTNVVDLLAEFEKLDKKEQEALEYEKNYMVIGKELEAKRLALDKVEYVQRVLEDEAFRISGMEYKGASGKIMSVQSFLHNSLVHLRQVVEYMNEEKRDRWKKASKC